MLGGKSVEISVSCHVVNEHSSFHGCTNRLLTGVPEPPERDTYPTTVPLSTWDGADCGVQKPPKCLKVRRKRRTANLASVDHVLFREQWTVNTVPRSSAISTPKHLYVSITPSLQLASHAFAWCNHNSATIHLVAGRVTGKS